MILINGTERVYGSGYIGYMEGQTVVFNDSYDWFNGTFQFVYNPKGWPYEFIPPAVGVYNIPYKVKEGSTTIVDSSIQITVVALSNAFELRETCCDKAYNIAWLNREGGWRSFIFKSRNDAHKIDIESVETFVTDGVIRTSEIKELKSIKVTTGLIDKSDIDYTATLRSGIQAFLYNPSSRGWDIPIWIKPESFTLYEGRQKLFEFSFEFILAEIKNIQTQ
jgi:hypothetical protein